MSENSAAPRPRRRLSRTVLIGAGLIVLALLWLGLRLLRPAQEDEPPAATSVALATARTQEVPQTFEAIGTVEPLVAATVRAQLSGTLMAIDVQEGQRVRKGQVIARIDDRPYTIALDQARAAMARDQAQLDNARLDLARYQRLLAQDSIAAQQVTSQQATVRQLSATVAADQAQVADARLKLSYTRLIAPVTGRVGLRQADIGDLVGPSDPAGVFTVTQEAPVDVSFALAQENLSRLTQSGSIPVAARDQQSGRTLANGILRALDNAVDSASGTVTAKARFANADGVLFPGQFVTVTATTGTLRNVVVVPVSAIRHGEKNDFLFVVDSSGHARMRTVRTGPMQGEDIAVLSGLRAGERVVATGADALDDGSKVTPVKAARTQP